jgi:hypothetical protein
VELLREREKTPSNRTLGADGLKEQDESRSEEEVLFWRRAPAPKR